MTAVQSHAEGMFTTLTLDTPHNRNALSSALVDELSRGLRDAAADPSVRAVVLTHTGGTFCAGADLTEAGATPEFRTQQMVDVMRLILETPKPVIAQIDGHVRAGGMGLVCACDIAIAGPKSTFALTESRLGLAPAAISLTLLPRMTSRSASRYFLTGEKFDSREAAAIGVVSEAATDAPTSVAELLAELAKASPQGLAESKYLTTIRTLADFDQYGSALAAQSARLFASDEAREGMTAFLQKRAPAWAAG